MAKKSDSKPKANTSRTVQRRMQREKQKQRQRQQILAVVLVVVAVLVFLLVIVSSRPTEAPVPENIEAEYEGLTQTTTEKGYPQIGDPDAPVRVVEYSSFACPGCAQFDVDVFPAILERVKAGQVNFTFVPLLTGSVNNPEGAARAALCASEQGKFWEMHTVLFNWHREFVNTAFSDSRLRAGVDALGMDGGTFNSCFNAQRTTDILVNAQNEGVSSTPTVTVQGTEVATASYDVVINAIDQAIINAGQVPLQPQTTDTEASPTVAPDTVEATQEADVEATSEPADTDMEMTPEPEATDEADS